MGGCSKAQVGSSVPVAAVVAGVEAGAAEIGDLVVLKASFTQGLAHQGEHLRAEFIIGRLQLALLLEGMQRGILLIGETVG